MSKLGNIRDNALGQTGVGRLIRIESDVLGIVLFIVLVVNNVNIWLSIGIGVAVVFLFPIFIKIFNFVGWVAAFIFSIFWAILCIFILDLIPGVPSIIYFVTFVIVFIISMTVHKVYSGLRAPKIKGTGVHLSGIFHKSSGGDSDEFNVLPHSKSQTVNNEYQFSQVVFCKECGRRISSEDGKCPYCNKV